MTHDNAEYVKLEDGCILWDGPVNSAGYGPHRTAWQTEHGQIPDGLEIDHLCRVAVERFHARSANAA